jgi:hypothetical protein
MPQWCKYSPKNPVVCLLADKAIIFLVAEGKLLAIDTLHLIG